MKLLFLSLILTLAFGILVQETSAQTAQTVNVGVGSQKKASRSKISVKFVSVIEDSRCPPDVQCIQAGNARVKVKVSKPGSKPLVFEVNTNLGEKGAVYEGYAIYLTKLSPVPETTARMSQNTYKATFSVSRLSR
jgi:hypothetical protein